MLLYDIHDLCNTIGRKYEKLIGRLKVMVCLVKSTLYLIFRMIKKINNNFCFYYNSTILLDVQGDIISVCAFVFSLNYFI